MTISHTQPGSKLPPRETREPDVPVASPPRSERSVLGFLTRAVRAARRIQPLSDEERVVVTSTEDGPDVSGGNDWEPKDVPPGQR